MRRLSRSCKGGRHGPLAVSLGPPEQECTLAAKKRGAKIAAEVEKSLRRM
jgi:hypothetical protein